jgi:hypothetical protein
MRGPNSTSPTVYSRPRRNSRGGRLGGRRARGASSQSSVVAFGAVDFLSSSQRPNYNPNGWYPDNSKALISDDNLRRSLVPFFFFFFFFLLAVHFAILSPGGYYCSKADISDDVLLGDPLALLTSLWRTCSLAYPAISASGIPF